MATGKLTWNDAIAKVLRVAGQPMNYLDITEAIVPRELRDAPTATPAYTVAAQFSEDKKKGEKSRFVWVSKGVYGLREWAAAGGCTSPDKAARDQGGPFSEIAVQAYGIFWDREGVAWNKSTPKLLGQQFENADLVDFTEQRGIYVLFDHRTLAYVGRATAQSLGSRLRDHTVDRLRSRWDRFSWIGFWAVKGDGQLVPPSDAGVDLDGVVSVLEAVLIELAEPPQNRQQGKGLGGIEYLQRYDPAIRRQTNQELLGVLAKAIDVNSADA